MLLAVRILVYILWFYNCETKIQAIESNESELTLRCRITNIIDYEQKSFRIQFKILEPYGTKNKQFKGMNGYIDLNRYQYDQLLYSLRQKQDNDQSILGQNLELNGHFNKIPVQSNPGEQNPVLAYLGYRSLGKFAYNSVEFYSEPELDKHNKVNDTSIVEIQFRKFRYNIFNYLLARITRSFQQPLQGLVIAMLLGNRNYLDEFISESYREQGLIHIIAISGLHISFLFILMDSFLKFWFRSQRIRLYSSLFLLCSYLFIIGFNVSALRASTMIILYQLSVTFRFPFYGIRTLFLSAFMYLMLFPFLLFQVGFILSYAAVFGVIVLSPILKKSFKVLTKRKQVIEPVKKETVITVFLHSILELVIVNISVNVMLYPVLAYFFGGISVTSLVANLFILPSIAVFYIFMLLSVLTFSYNSIHTICFSFIVKSLYGYINFICFALNQVPNHYKLVWRPSFVFTLAYYIAVLVIIKLLSNYIRGYDREETS